MISGPFVHVELYRNLFCQPYSNNLDSKCSFTTGGEEGEKWEGPLKFKFENYSPLIFTHSSTYCNEIPPLE